MGLQACAPVGVGALQRLRRLDGEPQPGTIVDAVSAVVSRAGREIGPSTPVVGRIGDEDFRSTSPLRVLANPSTFALTGWRFEAVDGRRKLICEVDVDREHRRDIVLGRGADGEPHDRHLIDHLAMTVSCQRAEAAQQ